MRHRHSSGGSWSLSFQRDRWPSVIRPAYREYTSVFEPRAVTSQGRVQPSDLRVILNTADVPAVHQARARAAEFTDDPPRLSGEFPNGPNHPDEPRIAVEPKWEQFAPKKQRLGLIGTLVDVLSGASAARNRIARDRFNQVSEDWRRERYERERAELAYRSSVQHYERNVADHQATRVALEKELLEELERYDSHKRQFENMRAADIASFDSLIHSAAKGSQEGIEALAVLVLRCIPLPSAIVCHADARFDIQSKILLITVVLPNLEEARLGVQLKTKFRDATEKEVRSSQEFLVHALSLRLMHEVFITTELRHIQMACVNMRLSYTNRYNGSRMDEIISSVAVTREEFSGINIADVDAKLCFRSLKGISAPSFHDLSPVRPILAFDRDDKRIVESREVVDALDPATNLAAMDWEEFEHVVRELFSKMFSTRSEGVEVHVTRASRDYGVDALVYDPDPIHGGKFVIQAKRYVNTVDVAAVRDLFGTVQNEGANRGYLVTTSSFGPDAHAFARNKPLTLVDGSHLLQLLQDHGYSFRINLEEARQLLRAGA